MPPSSAPMGGMAGTKKPTAVTVIQVIFYIFGVYTVLGVFFAFAFSVGGALVGILGTVILAVIAVGFLVSAWGMGKRAPWSFWAAMGTLGVNLVFSIYPVVSVLAIVITLVLAYSTWKQKVYLMGGGATKA